MEKAVCPGYSSPLTCGDGSDGSCVAAEPPLAPMAEPFDPVIDVELGLPVLAGAVWVDYYRGAEPMHGTLYVDPDNVVDTCLEGLIRYSGFDRAVSVIEALDMVGP